jgi:hypothetical protein
MNVMNVQGNLLTEAVWNQAVIVARIKNCYFIQEELFLTLSEASSRSK